jgi:ADP-heptose:LPS heptosyltransferase
MKKILIIRFSSIGDIVLTTPVVRSLKAALPEAEVHFLTKAAYRDILRHNPYLDQLHLWQDKPGGLIRQLRRLRFDHVIDLHKNLRSLRVKLSLMRPASSFDKYNREKLRMVRSPSPLPSIPHIVKRYGESLEMLGVSLDEGGLDFFLTPELEDWSLQELEEAKMTKPLAVVLGATHKTKRWLPEYFVSLLNQLRQPVLLIGGKDSASEAETIVSQLKIPFFNAVGRYNLLQSAALMKRAHTVIAHDTGFMHIAAAFGQRVISLWGNTVPELGMTPYQTPHEILEVKGLSCRPCSKLGFEECPQGHFRCMRDLKPEMVWERILK